MGTLNLKKGFFRKDCGIMEMATLHTFIIENKHTSILKRERIRARLVVQTIIGRRGGENIFIAELKKKKKIIRNSPCAIILYYFVANHYILHCRCGDKVNSLTAVSS